MEFNSRSPTQFNMSSKTRFVISKKSAKKFAERASQDTNSSDKDDGTLRLRIPVLIGISRRPKLRVVESPKKRKWVSLLDIIRSLKCAYRRRILNTIAMAACEASLIEDNLTKSVGKIIQEIDVMEAMRGVKQVFNEIPLNLIINAWKKAGFPAGDADEEPIISGEEDENEPNSGDVPEFLRPVLTESDLDDIAAQEALLPDTECTDETRQSIADDIATHLREGRTVTVGLIGEHTLEASTSESSSSHASCSQASSSQASRASTSADAKDTGFSSDDDLQVTKIVTVIRQPRKTLGTRQTNLFEFMNKATKEGRDEPMDEPVIIGVDEVVDDLVTSESPPHIDYSSDATIEMEEVAPEKAMSNYDNE